MRGGEVVVGGDAGEEAVAGMRRGLVVIGGRAGAGAGLRMLAGTVIALGGLGPDAGIHNKRGTLASGAALGGSRCRAMRVPSASGRPRCGWRCCGPASSGCPSTTR